MPFFICPNCKERSVDHDRLEELDDIPVACHHCGFGFLFELMDDYYPAPNAGLVVCDQNGRVLACGRGVFELTGYSEGALLGRDVVESLGLSGFAPERNPAQLALEWGVRRLGEQLEQEAEAAVAARDGLEGQPLAPIVVDRALLAVRADEERHAAAG